MTLFPPNASVPSVCLQRGACQPDNTTNMTFLCEQAQGADESEGRYELKPDMSLVHHHLHC